VTQGVNRNAVNRWHAYREAFEPVLPILRPMLERFGYEAWAFRERAAQAGHCAPAARQPGREVGNREPWAV